MVFLSVIVLLLLSVNSAKSQDNRSERMQQLIMKLDSVVQTHQPYARLSQNPSSVDVVSSIFRTSSLVESQPRYPDMNMLEAERRNILQDWGVDLQAGYLENLKQGVFDAEGIFYNRRYRLGVEWDVLSSGWQENRLKAKQLQREMKIARIERQEELDQRIGNILEEKIRALMQQRRTEVRDHYIQVVKMKQHELKTLYDLGYKSWDEVLEASSDVRTKGAMLQQNENADSLLSLTGIGTDFRLPVLSIDLSTLEEAIKEQPNKGLADSLRVRNIEDEYRPWRDISLSANLSYSYYDRSSEQIPLQTTGDREYFSFGVNVSVPLTVFKKHHRLYKKAKNEELTYKNRLEDNDALRKLRSYYRDYRKLKNEYAESYYRHVRLSKEMLDEKGKKNFEVSDYSPARMLNLLIEQFQVVWDLIDRKEKLYLKLIQIKTMASEIPLHSYASIWQPAELMARDKMASIIYLQSDTYDRNDPDFIVEYLKLHQFDKLFFSPGKLPAKKTEEIRRFIENVRAAGIEIHLMKDSRILFSEQFRESISRFVELAERLGVDGIHLDVEPYTLEDWDQKREVFADQYGEMADYIGKILESKKLGFSLSVPVYHDSIPEKFQILVDELYIIAYGDRSGDALLKALENKRLTYTGSQVVVALRPENFSSVEELQTLMSDLSSQISEVKYALLDFEELLEKL